MKSWYPGETKVLDFFDFTPKSPTGAVRGADAQQDDEDMALIRQLAALVLLYDVPFAYLIPAESMLEPEQIRFFHLDQNWVRALLDGAFSIGRNMGVDTANDEAFLESVLAEAIKRSEAIRPALQGKPEATRQGILSRAGDFICTGFILRSKLVSGWRGLEITAYGDDAGTNKLTTLRLETLSDEVLLGLYGGVIRRLDMSQPPEGLHFGFNRTGGKRTKCLRDLKSGTLVYDKDEVALVERGNRVINVKASADAMQKALGMGNEAFTSAHFALEMIQNPYTAQIKIGDEA